MFTLNGRGKLRAAGSPLVMSILNITPDSFYGGSRFEGQKQVLEQAEKMLQDGADILDIGGQSTRPGAEWVGEEEELRRGIPPIASLRQQFPNLFLSGAARYRRLAQEPIPAAPSVT